LETASKLAGETAKAVSTNESVKNLNIGKIGMLISQEAYVINYILITREIQATDSQS
jgi:hypothetical protein